MYDAIRQYKEQAVSTMSRGEQLSALYAEALKNLRYGSLMMTNQNYPAAEACIEKCRDIFRYLSSVLDRQYGVSAQLYELYSFIGRELVRANVRRDSEPIEGVIPLVETLADTWAKAEKLTHMNNATAATG